LLRIHGSPHPHQRVQLIKDIDDRKASIFLK